MEAARCAVPPVCRLWVFHNPSGNYFILDAVSELEILRMPFRICGLSTAVVFASCISSEIFLCFAFEMCELGYSYITNDNIRVRLALRYVRATSNGAHTFFLESAAKTANQWNQARSSETSKSNWIEIKISWISSKRLQWFMMRFLLWGNRLHWSRIKAFWGENWIHIKTEFETQWSIFI